MGSGEWCIENRSSLRDSPPREFEVPETGALSIIVLGASGDFAKKKTFRALLNLYQQGFLPPEEVHIFGYARTKISDDDLRNRLHGGWTHIVVQKPFGTNLKFVEQLSSQIGELFDEPHIYRIDHYLQRELVQNMINLLGCSKLTMEDILFSLSSLKSSGKPGIKQLRVAGPDGYPHVTERQFIGLIDSLDADSFSRMRDQYLRFYHGGRDPFLISEDDRPIDVEVCPLCQESASGLWLA